jgi:hypothetical protein
MVTLPTSNSWWIFDDAHSRYRRIPRDMNPEAIVLDGDWEPYSELEIDPDESAFTVFLNEDKTRIMRGYIEAEEYHASYDDTSVASDA